MKRRTPPARRPRLLPEQVTYFQGKAWAIGHLASELAKSASILGCEEARKACDDAYYAANRAITAFAKGQ